MDKNPDRTSKIAASIGGFLIMVGMILLGIFALALFKIIDPELLVDGNFATMFMLILTILGVFDLISGIILSLR